MTAFKCPKCGRTSQHPRDAAEQYCGHCHQFVEFMEPCPECDGRGEVLDAPSDVLEGHPFLVPCPDCQGTGKRTR